MSYDWIAEEIRWLKSKKWKTKGYHEQLKELYELRDALHTMDKSKKKGGGVQIKYDE